MSETYNINNESVPEIATAESAANHFPVYDRLLPGEQNAIKASRLADLLGFANTRDVATEVMRERAAGKVICSSGEGYYLASDDQDIRRFICCLEARAKNTLAALQSAKKCLRERGVADGGSEMD